MVYVEKRRDLERRSNRELIRTGEGVEVGMKAEGNVQVSREESVCRYLRESCSILVLLFERELRICSPFRYRPYCIDLTIRQENDQFRWRENLRDFERSFD